MDNDDDSSLSPTPNDFVISTYSDNPLANTNMKDSFNVVFAYQCTLCCRTHNNLIVTCRTCLNTGRFCSSKHYRCSKEDRELLFSLLNEKDGEEFEHYLTQEPMHVPCSDQILLLEKFQSEKLILLTEYERKANSMMKVHRMSEDIQLRKIRLRAARYSIEKFREKNEQKKAMNLNIQGRIDQTRMRILDIRPSLTKIKRLLRSSQSEITKMIDFRTQSDNLLHGIRRYHLNELMTYIFPIQRIAASEDALANRIKALERAQETIADSDEEGIEDQAQTPEELVPLGKRYQLVYSFLPENGNYQIVNLATIYNSGQSPDSDSPQLSPSRESYDTLAALSHACQVVNIMAFFLDIKLPFHLHHWEFNKEEMIVDDLRADIAKLNANIISSCLSQGIPIEFAHVSCTLENLVRLLTLEQYASRPKSVIYPQSYIDILDTEVINVQRALTTSYWFDSCMDNDDEDVAKLLISGEYEVITENEYSSDDIVAIHRHSDSSPSTSSQPQPSAMSSSLDYLKTRSSNLISSILWSSKP